MKITDIGEVVSMLEREAYHLELERERLATHLSLVRNLRDAAKAYLTSKEELKDDDVFKTVFAKIKRAALVRFAFGGDKNDKNNGSSSARNNDTSSESLNNTFSINERPQGIPSDVFKGLSQKQALFEYLSICNRNKQTPWEIEKGLRAGGFEPKSFYLSESLNAMLRYYERKGLLVRDGMYKWGLAKQNTAEEQPPAERNRNGRFSSNGKSSAEYCIEILKDCGKPFLHVDEIVETVNKKYGLNKSKDVIAAVLRKNAKSKRFFAALGKNRFGLLNEPNAEGNGRYRQIP